MVVHGRRLTAPPWPRVCHRPRRRLALEVADVGVGRLVAARARRRRRRRQDARRARVLRRRARAQPEVGGARALRAVAEQPDGLGHLRVERHVLAVVRPVTVLRLQRVDDGGRVSHLLQLPESLQYAAARDVRQGRVGVRRLGRGRSLQTPEPGPQSVAVDRPLRELQLDRATLRRAVCVLVEPVGRFRCLTPDVTLGLPPVLTQSVRVVVMCVFNRSALGARWRHPDVIGAAVGGRDGEQSPREAVRGGPVSGADRGSVKHEATHVTRLHLSLHRHPMDAVVRRTTPLEVRSGSPPVCARTHGRTHDSVVGRRPTNYDSNTTPVLCPWPQHPISIVR